MCLRVNAPRARAQESQGHRQIATKKGLLQGRSTFEHVEVAVSGRFAVSLRWAACLIGVASSYLLRQWRGLLGYTVREHTPRIAYG